MSEATTPTRARSDDIPVLPADVPVAMPELSPRLIITTTEQFKAISEPTRTRILGIIQNQPATAKQIADRLHIAPGAVGHHLQVLEAAGMAQIVAKRLVRGIVAKYYARTARIFLYKMSPDVTGGVSPSMDIVNSAAREFADSVAERPDEPDECKRGGISFPHARLSPERIAFYEERLGAIVDDFIAEPQDPDGEIYGLLVAMFRSPNYMQNDPTDMHADQVSDASTKTEGQGDKETRDEHDR